MSTLFEQSARDPRFTGNFRRARPCAAAMSVALAVALCLIVAHAALIPLGNWHYDEFDTFRNLREGGISFVWARIVGWSPRPFSEYLLYLYGTLVEETGRPNVTLFLGVLWLTLAAGLFLPILRVSRASPRYGLLLTTIGAVVFASFLVGHRIDEVFFWTQGAVAYVPTLATISAVAMIHIARPHLSAGTRILTGCLVVVGALSSEIGALFAVTYGSSMLVLNRIRRVRPLQIMAFRPSHLEYMMAVIAGLSIFYLSSKGRLGVSFEAVGDPAIVHQILPSLVAAMRYAPMEFLTLGAADGGYGPFLRGSFAALAFCVGVWGLFAVGGRPAERQTCIRLLAIGLAAMGAAFLSLMAAYYQFGIVCCSRHETMRRCLTILSLLCFVFVIYSLFSERLTGLIGNTRLAWAACMMTVASLLAGLSASYRPLLADYADYGRLASINRNNWDSGTSQGNSMLYRPSDSKMICSPLGLNPGTYRANEDMPPHVAYIARYFGKSEVVISGNTESCYPM